MAHVVFTSPVCRLELNLNEDDAAVVADVLLDLVKRPRAVAVPRPAAPGCDCGLPVVQPTAAVVEVPVPPHTMRVEEPEATQVTAPEPEREPDADDLRETRTASAPKVPARERLLPRTCEREGCDTVFQPDRSTARFCSRGCGMKVAREAYRSRKKGAPQDARSAAPEPNRTVSKGTAAPRTSDIPANPVSPKVTPPEDRPYRCKEEGCGHPCRSQGELNSHRVAYHQVKQGLPKVTAVLGSMEFPCPHDGCGRVYDDENRLIHHLRVIHEPAVARGEERVVLSDAEVVHGLNAGTLRGVKIG